MRRLVNILIVNCGSKLNKGSAAILSGKISIISKVFPNSQFTELIYSKIPRNQKELPKDKIEIKKLPVIIRDTPSNLVKDTLISIIMIVQSFLNDAISTNIKITVHGKSIQEFANEYTPKERICLSLSSLQGYILLIYSGLILSSSLNNFNLNKFFIPARLRPYIEADLILNTGGDVLTEDYGTELAYFCNILFGIILNKPCIICAESIGPFNKKINKILARYIFNRMILITLREEYSLYNLKDINVNKIPIEITADVAFMLEPASVQAIDEILNSEGITKCRPLIGISVSKIISGYGFLQMADPKSKYDRYVQLMADITDYFINKFDSTVVFIPHVYGPGYADDRITADDICRLVTRIDQVKSIKKEYSPEELKGLIGECDLFIGARMHATIASTSMLVPTIGIAYSQKMHGIIGKMLGQEKYTIDIKDLNYENMVLKINDVWVNKDEIRRELAFKIPLIKEKARLNGELIKNYFNLFL